MDLCAETFKRVEGFCMVYMFGSERFKRKAEYVKARWGVDLKEVEHYGAVQHRKFGEWCLPQDVGDLPTKIGPAFERQRQEYGIPLLATGTRMYEHFSRRVMIKRGTWPGWHPIAEWRRADVANYLKARSIPFPDDENKDMQGVSMHRSCIEEMYRSNRGDYELLRQRFPMVEAVVKRGGWYGN
jgi:hypothetical protein